MSIAGRDFRELRLENLNRSFGMLNALNGISLSIERGEFIALLGPSGCGKSTALNCLAGLLTLTGGSIWLDQTRIDRLKPEERGFGMVFQNYALFPHMTVRRNIGFGLAMQRKPKEEIARKVEEALAIVRLGQQGDKLPGQLSGGQQQRVAIARALINDPEVLLADEPTGNLDSASGETIMEMLRALHTGGTTILMVTHDPRFITMADRLVNMLDGKMTDEMVPLV